ncbi:MAG TPA: hypothetical protein VHM91_00055, partial [Verrucomicrobiales bacterium]|nr:hypothetical protein [Verrucomicrobiales bacterium]
MKAIRRFLIAATLLTSLTDNSSARLMRTWSKQELLDKSDLVVIATPVSSTNTGEPVSLPETPAALATGVNTKFKVSLILKGPEEIREITLHHARPADPPGVTINGPLLASFDGAVKQSWLLYLVREKDGTYAPVSGQTDPALQAIVAANSVPPAVTDSAQPAPGPENGGLRMRLIIAPDKTAKAQAQHVKIELLNVSDKPVTLRSAWEYDEQTGNFDDYLESATGIETYPAIEPWSGQVRMGGRSRPQEEKVLKAGETLTVGWLADGRRLKNKVSDPLSVQNPEFPVPGLYSVHAVLHLPTAAGMVSLRSNEQQFAAGNSVALPKSTFGQVISADPKSNFGQINLGTIHQVKTGDQFRIRTGYSEYYRLTITKTEPSWSGGTLAPEPLTLDDSRRGIPFPSVGQGAVFTQEPPVNGELEK